MHSVLSNFSIDLYSNAVQWKSNTVLFTCSCLINPTVQSRVSAPSEITRHMDCNTMIQYEGKTKTPGITSNICLSVHSFSATAWNGMFSI